MRFCHGKSNSTIETTTSWQYTSEITEISSECLQDTILEIALGAYDVNKIKFILQIKRCFDGVFDFYLQKKNTKLGYL